MDNKSGLKINLEESILIGPKGKSAYDIAIDNGFKGTEEEWLESLKSNETILIDGPINSSFEIIPYAISEFKYLDIYYSNSDGYYFCENVFHNNGTEVYIYMGNSTVLLAEMLGGDTSELSISEVSDFHIDRIVGRN